MVNDTSEPKTLPPGGVGDDQAVEAEAVERPLMPQRSRAKRHRYESCLMRVTLKQIEAEGL